MNKISIKGVIIGAIVDVVASGIAGIPLILYVIMHMKTVDAQSGPAAIVSHIHADLTLHSIQLAFGFACSVLGGYIAARIARRGEVLNGTLSSFLCILFGIYAATSGTLLVSPAEHALLLAASVAAAAFGGFLARKPAQFRAA
jgi:hypothetical protein